MIFGAKIHKLGVLALIQKRLRFYVRCDFIVSSTKFNFVILLIKSFFSLKKIVSVDQVFFTEFSGKVSIT